MPLRMFCVNGPNERHHQQQRQNPAERQVQEVKATAGTLMWIDLDALKLGMAPCCDRGAATPSFGTVFFGSRLLSLFLSF